MRNDHKEIDDLRLPVGNKLGQSIQPVAPRRTAAAVIDNQKQPSGIYSQLFETPHLSPGYNFSKQFQMSMTLTFQFHFELILATASAVNLWLARTGIIEIWLGPPHNSFN